MTYLADLISFLDLLNLKDFKDFFERPLPLAQLMLSLSVDTATEGNR